MRLRGTVMAAACGVALAAAPALAQGRPLPLQKPPTHAQIGTGQATAPRAAQRGPSERGRRGGGYDRGWSGYGSGYVPMMIGQDGNVYANFGYGYERVLRQCTMQQTVQQTVQQPRVQQPTPQAYSQPELTQPVPRPQTASPATGTPPSLSGLTSGNTQGMHVGPPTQMATAACWSRLPNGNVSVRR